MLCDTQGLVPAYSVMMTDGGDGTIRKPDAVSATNVVIKHVINTIEYHAEITIEYQSNQRAPHPGVGIVEVSYRWDAFPLRTFTYLGASVTFDKISIALTPYRGKNRMFYGSLYVIDVQGQYACVTVRLYKRLDESLAEAMFDELNGTVDAGGFCGGYVGSNDWMVNQPK